MGFQVMAKACETCIYRADSPLDLDALEAQVQGANDSFRVCHHHDTACCRGFWNAHKHDFNMGRIAQRLNAVEYVEATR